MKKKYKLSEETRKKMSLAHLGKRLSKETKLKMSIARKGKKIKPFTEEHKRNISLARKGRIISEETRRKLSLANIGNKYSLGYKHSEESKIKIGLAHLGNKYNLGRHHTEEAKKNMSLSKLGKFIGEKNPAWKGGTSFEPYDIKWNNIFRRRIRKRDNYVCLLCGIHQEKLKRVLCVHHINYNKLLSIPENCLSLCCSCHMQTNFNRKHWIKFFQSLMNEKYSYEYDNQEIIIK